MLKEAGTDHNIKKLTCPRLPWEVQWSHIWAEPVSGLTGHTCNSFPQPSLHHHDLLVQHPAPTTFQLCLKGHVISDQMCISRASASVRHVTGNNSAVRWVQIIMDVKKYKHTSILMCLIRKIKCNRVLEEGVSTEGLGTASGSKKSVSWVWSIVRKVGGQGQRVGIKWCGN